MIKFSEWEQKNFINSLNEPGITVLFPSRDIYFSQELLNLMRFEISTCPKTLDQWYELCHPSDHAKISKLENIIYNSHENFFSLTRKLYCGDGFYRNFRLDAFIQRHSDGRPLKIFANEISSLTAWLNEAQEGEQIEIRDDSGRVKILEAVRVAGTMTLNDITIKEDLEKENLTLRHEISRRIFSPFPAPLKISEDNAKNDIIFNILSENLDAAINILTGNTQLKALKRSLSSPFLNIAVTGLSGGGKTSLINALTGENFNVKDIPIFYTEGEKKSVKIFYQDGHILELGSRNEELGIINDVKRIEITTSGALIPEGVRLIDTPGFDSMTGAAALKNILPEIDFVIYVMPVSSRLKGSDYKFLEELGIIVKELENDNPLAFQALSPLSGGARLFSSNLAAPVKGRGTACGGGVFPKEGLIFVLSKIDLENDDTEAGKIIYTSNEKILSDIDAVKKYFDVAVLPVSSKIAKENFYNRNSDAWENSNIESVIKYIEVLSRNVTERVLFLRTQRALKILEKAKTNLLKWQLDPIINNLRKIEIKNEKIEISSETLETKKFLISNSSLVTEKSPSLFSSLITSMREHSFKERFFSLSAFNGNRKAILLSADKNMSMKLFARLGHNLRLSNLPEGNSSLSEWLCSGEIMPFDCIKLISSISENILIAPPDYLLNEKINFAKLFSDYVPVVSVELSRLESGLSDLVHAPYITGLALSEWILAYPDAALISDINDIKIKINNFAQDNGIKNPEFFIYENYKII